MNFKILMFTSLLFVGCQEVDTEALKVMNSSEPKSFAYTKEEPKKEKVASAKEVKKIEPVAVKEEVKVKTVEPIKKEIEKEELVKQSVVKPNDTYALIAKNLQEESDRKFELALKQIEQKKEESNQKNEFSLALAKLENQQKIILKSKDLEINKAEVDGKVAMAEIELKKVQESEKTAQIARTQEHQEKLLDNRSLLDISKKKLDLYKILVGVLGFLLLIYFIVSYYTKKKSSDEKIQINQDQLKHQVQLKMIEQHGSNLHKMLDIITSKELTPAVEKELLLAIKESQKKTPIFDEKQKKGLIFRS